MADKRVLRARNVNAFSAAVQKILNAKSDTELIVLRGNVQKLRAMKNFSYFDLTESGQFIRCYCPASVLDAQGIQPAKDMKIDVRGDLQVYDRQSLVQIEVSHIRSAENAKPLPDSMRLFSPLQMNQYIANLVQSIAQDHQFVLSGTVSGFRALAKYDYFDLGDEKQSIRCILWDEVRKRVNFQVDNGIQLQVMGDLEVYENEATLQLNVRALQQAEPDTTLTAQYREVIEQLAKRGLWPKRDAHPLPRTIKRIGFITSQRSKSWDDFHKTYTDMNGQAEIIDAFAWVEGKNAASQIATAINRFSQNKAVDVILISRGGGAQEKLSAVFDSYLVAEAICQSRVPVITAIGHSSDETFADVIADDSMDTPTRAAVELARIKAKRGLFG